MSARVLTELLMGPTRSYCVYAAAKLGIADHLAAGPASAERLAGLTETDSEALYRLLRMLAALGITAADDGGFRLGELGELLRSDHPESMRDLVVCFGELLHPPYAHILHSLRTGEQAYAQVHGAPVFDHLAQDAAAGRLFDRAMAGGSAVFRALADAVDLSGAHHIIDVGGGDGTLLAEVLRNYPEIRGTLAEAPGCSTGRASTCMNSGWTTAARWLPPTPSPRSRPEATCTCSLACCTTGAMTTVPGCSGPYVAQ